MTRGRSYAVVVGAIVVTGALLAVLPLAVSTIVAVAATLVFLGLARRLLLTADDLGLARGHLGSGARWAAASAGGFALVYAVALVVPATHDLLVDDRSPDSLADLAVRVLLVIPLHTVVLEELVFRGVVQGMVRRDRGVRTATVVSSLLFGLWHLGSASSALAGNQAVSETLGASPLVTFAGMVAIVSGTALAGVVLAYARERSGSLLAPMGLHWAANAAGTIATYVATR
ncbi:CPBP family intramembrane glutamic endopeptidase [Mumia zhuanghuii]|uniref:CPBP family intramembrane glutamic endopeptidase n=1 Tax=Mumia zhuanghuii TaxID=2585211 RepID=UPI00363F9834